MTLNDFLGEYIDPKFQEQLKLVDKVLEYNKVLERLLEWQKQQKQKLK
jgi:hypothetical protein